MTGAAPGAGGRLTVKDFTVGQVLWLESQKCYRPSSKVTVEKIGRVWVSISTGHRFDPAIMRAVDKVGGETVGVIYVDVQQAAAEKARETAWSHLRAHLAARYSPPDGITIERIRQAAALLLDPSYEAPRARPSPGRRSEDG